MKITNNFLKNSKFISLIVQIVTGVIGAYALTRPVPPEHFALKQSLGIEMFVQVIQISMYIWIISRFHIPSMAITRYTDWIITTPLMLLSIMLYFAYDAKQKVNSTETITIRQFLHEHFHVIMIAVIGNLVMLFFGLLGELGVIDKTLATIIGFAGLIVAFGIIYTKFTKTKETTVIFFITFTVWSLYGVAYNLDDIPKNIFYNILDIIAKNVFGLFLSSKVLRLSSM
jgi:bacteriorhodopsin